MSDITILISTSPRPSHPSPRILDQTIISARAQLPNSPIIIMADGPVSTDAYSQFVAAITDRYSNTIVQVHHENVQQSGMLGRALEEVVSPLILYLEDDWEFVNTIEWERLSDIIQSGFANYIRFYAGHRIIPENEHMMIDRMSEQGVPFVRTIQWSQNPHLASTAFYRDPILSYCQGKTDMIENLLHGPCASEPWERWRLCIYNGIADATMQRVRHLDGKNSL